MCCENTPSVSSAIAQTLDALTIPRIVKQFIHLLLIHQELRQIKTEFRGTADIQGVAGVVDGTHINIIVPKQHEAEYVNLHDTRIWNECRLKELFEGNRVPAGYHLLGNSGYSCELHLLTPYLPPQSGPQTHYKRYNYMLVVDCAIVHNICKARSRDLLPEDDDDSGGDDGDYEHMDGHDSLHIALPAAAACRERLILRDEFVLAHFNFTHHVFVNVCLPQFQLLNLPLQILMAAVGEWHCRGCWKGGGNSSVGGGVL
ncbi:putative nuclease HARBI1 [Scylla paramamosain]|uniref:putative nuclease HARBI1 n=1 Tax=Scylla paramamosain TaxID=85552 RepID=UPI0030838424